MSITLNAIDHIFEAMLASYGTDFTRRYSTPGKSQETVLASMKSEWAHRLSSLSDAAGFASIAWALDNLPEQPPNSIQFRNLCRQAPSAAMPQRQEPEPPPANPKRIREALAKLGRPQVERPVGRQLDWARSIRSRHLACDRSLSRAQVEMALDALKYEGRPLSAEEEA